MSVTYSVFLSEPQVVELLISIRQRCFSPTLVRHLKIAWLERCRLPGEARSYESSDVFDEISCCVCRGNSASKIIERMRGVSVRADAHEVVRCLRGDLGGRFDVAAIEKQGERIAA